MEDLLKKKNLRARKGKQKWRKNIDSSFLEKQIEEHQTKIRLEKEVQEKLSKKPLQFTIDVQPDMKVKKILEKDRFKKKVVQLPAKKGERKLIDKLSKKIKKVSAAATSTRSSDAAKTQDLERVQDVWTNPKLRTRKKLPLEETPIAPVILPDAGQSYNPSFKAHREFLNSVADLEMEQDSLKPLKKKNPIITLIPDSKIDSVDNVKRKRPKNLKARLQIEEELARKREKIATHQFNLLKKMKKEDKQNEEEMERRRKEQDEKEKIKQEELKKGIVKKGKKFGKFRYSMKTPDFQLVEDMVPNLRKIKPVEGGIGRERFDSIYRRNLIESANPFSKKKKRKVPLYKFHSVNRDKKTKEAEEDEELLGNQKNIEIFD